MLTTPHVIVGLAIAKTFPNPFLSIPLSFVSHFALEMVPHWNPHLNTEMRTYGHLTLKTKAIIVLDTAISFASTIYITHLVGGGSEYVFYASAIAAIAPDLIEAPYFFLHMKNKVLAWWLRGQKAIQSDANPFWGLLTQFMTIILTLVWIFVS